MKHFFIGTLIFLSTYSRSKEIDPSAQQMLRGNGMNFIENKGQVIDMDAHLRPDIFYVGDGGGAKVYLRTSGVSYVMTKIEGLEENEEEEHPGLNEFEEREKKFENATVKGHRVDMEFVGGNLHTKKIQDDEVEGEYNYYLGHCSDGITGVRSYNKVVYEGVYKNIDVAYYGGKEKGLKYDIIVKPYGRVGDIVMKYSGADKIQLVDDKLKIATTVGELGEWLPKIYQNINGKIIEVVGSYDLQGEEVRIRVEDYDKSKELIIDPWVTYYGGSGNDWGSGIATDNFNNVVIIGTTVSPDFPVTPGAFQTALGGGSDDAFVVKLDSSGKRLWATYYGGSGMDWGFGIATDNFNNVVITGRTSSPDFPVTPGAFQTVFGGGLYYDAYVVKLDSSGKRLWATYYGGSYSDFCEGIATDNFNNVVITGITNSPDFPVTPGAFQTVYGGAFDAFVIKLDSSGKRLWATYYGGSKLDRGYGIATDKRNNVVITGITHSLDFPVTPGAFQRVFEGAYDAFVIKLDSVGKRLWATYYGGSTPDWGWGIATDNFNNVVITGHTGSPDFPVTPGAFQTVLRGGWAYDAFVIKLDSSGKRLWATFLGGPNMDEGMGIATDKNNNIYVVGDNYDGGLPMIGCSYQPRHGGCPQTSCEDNFVFKFDGDGHALYSTYLGARGHDESFSIAVYGSDIYITGFTDNDYPVTSNAFQKTFGGGGWDAFIARIEFPSTHITETPATGCNDCNGTATIQIPCGVDTIGISYTWNTTPVQTTKTATGLCPGTYTATATTARDGSFTDSITVTGGNLTPVITTTVRKQPGDTMMIPIVLDPAGNYANMKEVTLTVKYDARLLSLTGEPTSSIGKVSAITKLIGEVSFTVTPDITLPSPTAVIVTLPMSALLAPYTKGKIEITTSTITFTSGQQITAGGCPVEFTLDSSCIAPSMLRERSTLSLNHPNPFSSNTIIQYSIGKQQHVRLLVVDVFGRVVETLANREQEKGSYTIDFSAENYLNGMYFYRLETGREVLQRSMVIVK